tara:strand:+ start:45 stop:317 length:273 start_codon:yes stop_codon:yes gene_type:complete
MSDKKSPTLAELRAESVVLENKLEKHDEKINSSIVRRLLRKVKGASGISASARRSLVTRLDKIEKITNTEPTKDPVGKPVRRLKDGSMYP